MFFDISCAPVARHHLTVMLAAKSRLWALREPLALRSQRDTNCVYKYMCVCVFTCIYYSCWSMAGLELQPCEWSQGAVVICVCESVYVLTLCHSLTGRSVKSVGTCLFLVGLEGDGGERWRCVYICVFVWALVGEITHLPTH